MKETPEEREQRLMEEFRAMNASANVAMYVCIVAFVVWSLICFSAGWTIGVWYE